MADDGNPILKVGMDTSGHTAGTKQVVKNMDEIKSKTEATAKSFKSSWSSAVADVASQNNARLRKMLPDDAAASVGTSAAKSLTRGLTEQFKADQALVKSHLMQGLLDTSGAKEAAELNAQAYKAELTKLLTEMDASGISNSRQGRAGVAYITGLLPKDPVGAKKVDHYASRSVGLLQEQALKLNSQFDEAKNHTPTLWEKLFPSSTQVNRARKDMGMLDALHDEAVKHVGAHSMSMSRLEYMFEHFVSHAAGVSPLLGRVVGTMAHFAVGTIPMVAGLGALAGAFALWEMAMAPVHEQAKLLEEDLKKLGELGKKVDERRQGPLAVLDRPTDELAQREEDYKEHKKSSLFEGANRWFARHQGNTTALEDDEKNINDLKDQIRKGGQELMREREATQVQQLAGEVSSRFATAEQHKLSIELEKYYTAELLKQQSAQAVAVAAGDKGALDKTMERIQTLLGFIGSLHTANNTDPLKDIRDSAKDLINTLHTGPIESFAKSIDKWDESAKKAGISDQERVRTLGQLYSTLKQVHDEQLRPIKQEAQDASAIADASRFGTRAIEEATIQQEIAKRRHEMEKDRNRYSEQDYAAAELAIRGKHYANDAKSMNTALYKGTDDIRESDAKAQATIAGAKALREYNVELQVRQMREQAGLGVSDEMLKRREAQIRAEGQINELLAERQEIEAQIQSSVGATVGGIQASLDKIQKANADEVRKFNQPMEDAVKSMQGTFESGIEKMLDNSVHSFRDFAREVGGILSRMSGQSISLRIAEIVLGSRREVLDAQGRPTGNFENIGGAFGKGGLFQPDWQSIGTTENGNTESKRVGGGLEKYAGLARGVGGAAAGGLAGYAYGLTTTNKAQAAAGGALEGAMAGSAFGPIGAIVGGVAGLATGLMGSAHAAKQAAREMEEARKSFDSSMKAYVAVATRTNSALGDALRQNQDQARQLLLQANQAYSGKKNERERNSQRAAIEATAAENAKRLVEDWRKSLDEQMNSLQGDSYSNQLEEINKQYRENLNAAKAAGNAVGDLAKVERIRTLELQKAQRAHDLEINTTKEDYRVRTLMSQGRTYEADRLRQVIAQEKELADATERWGSTNPELIEQLKKVQELERLHGATELANAIRNGPTGFRVLGYSYEFANLDRPVGNQSADTGNTSTGNSGLDAPTGTNYSQPIAPYADQAITEAKENIKTKIGQQVNMTIAEGAIVIENDGSQSGEELAKKLVEGLRTIAVKTGGINATNSDTLDRI